MNNIKNNKRPFVATNPAPAPKHPRLEDHSPIFRTMNVWLASPISAKDVIPPHLFEGTMKLLANPENAAEAMGENVKEFLELSESLGFTQGLKTRIAEIAFAKATTKKERVYAALHLHLPDPREFRIETNLPESRVDCIHRLTKLLNDEKIVPILSIYLRNLGNFERASSSVLFSVFRLGQALGAPASLNEMMYDFAYRNTVQTSEQISLLEASAKTVSLDRSQSLVRKIVFYGELEVLRRNINRIEPYIHLGCFSEEEKRIIRRSIHIPSHDFLD